MNAAAIRTEHLRTPGHSKACSRAEMEQRVARFADRAPDPGAFPDLKKQQGQRNVAYVLSPPLMTRWRTAR